MLVQYCLDNAKCRGDYEQKLLDVADTFEALDLEAQLDAHLALVREDALSDPREEWSAAGRQADIDTTRENLREMPDFVRGLVD